MDDNVLTLDMILDLPNQLLNQTEKFETYIDVLSKETCEKHNVREYRLYVEKKFDQYFEATVINRFPVGTVIHISPLYELREYDVQKGISNPTELAALKLVKNSNYAEKFYNSMIVLSTKLTKQEIIYLVKTFFEKEKEDFICSILRIGKTKLQYIKKSCIIKMYFELKTLDDE